MTDPSTHTGISSERTAPEPVFGHGAGRDPYILLLVHTAGGIFGIIGAWTGDAPWGELRYLGDDESSVSQIRAGYEAGIEKSYGVCK